MASLDWSQCPAVESIPGKVSGAWVLRGTRTPVKVLFENLEAGMSIEEVIEQFPVSREQIDSLMAFVARSLEQQAPRIDESHCNKCGGTRRHFVRREHVVNGHDDEVSWSETMQILECCGCSELSVRKRSWFSEWDQSEPVMERGVQDQTYPPPLFRPLPRWIDKIEDDSVEDVLREVYSNLQAGNSISAAMGIRLLIDRIMNIKVGDLGSFTGTLEEMRKQGLIGQDEKEKLLDPVIDAGSAAAHRAYRPKADHLNTMMDTVENLVYRLLVLPRSVDELRRATPQRRR
jgi:uncharacterized protein (DUF433 family)